MARAKTLGKTYMPHARITLQPSCAVACTCPCTRTRHVTCMCHSRFLHAATHGDTPSLAVSQSRRGSALLLVFFPSNTRNDPQTGSAPLLVFSSNARDDPQTDDPHPSPHHKSAIYDAYMMHAAPTPPSVPPSAPPSAPLTQER